MQNYCLAHKTVLSLKSHEHTYKYEIKSKQLYFLFGRSTTPQQWEDFSRYNKDRADAEMQASNRLREAIHHTLHQTANDLEAQKVATEYAFRKRIHEFERAKDELEWQKKNVSVFAIDVIPSFLALYLGQMH